MKNLISLLIIVCFFATSCNNSQQQALESINKQKTIDSLNALMAEQKIIDSMKEVNISQEKARVLNADNGAASKQVTEPAAPKKKGWSGAAKGAVIGAGAGAIAGAIIDKKRGEGAIVGGLIGAGVGAGTGAIIDNSKKKKAAIAVSTKQ